MERHTTKQFSNKIISVPSCIQCKPLTLSNAVKFKFVYVSRSVGTLNIKKKLKNTKKFHLFPSFSVSKNQNDLILQKIDTSTFESTHNQSLCVCVYNALQPVLNFHLNEGKKKKYISFVLKTGFFLFRKRDSHVRRTQLM